MSFDTATRRRAREALADMRLNTLVDRRVKEALDEIHKMAVSARRSIGQMTRKRSWSGDGKTGRR